MDSKASTLNDFITHYRNGFMTETSLYGLQLNSSLVRAYSSNREESCSEEMKDLLEDLEESFDQCFPNEDFKDDPVSFWSMITDYFPGNEANGEMFRNEVSYCLCSKETEDLWFVEDFMENLSFDYKLDSDLVLSTFLLRKPVLNRKLLKEYSDAQLNMDGLFEPTDLLVNREDIMLLFMTMYPAAEDERVMMPEDVIEELIRYTEFEITYLSLLELIMLIHYSEKYRLPDEINMKWTKQYFIALSDRTEKGGNSWLN